VLIAGFVAIEFRSKAPLLPMRIFRLRTLSASNLIALLSGGALFAQFFLLTLYMQQVLHYSALQTGAAYLAFTLSVIVFATVSQALVTRIGIPPCPAGRAGSRGCRAPLRGPTAGRRALTSGNIFPPSCSAASDWRSRSCRCRSGLCRGSNRRNAGVASGLLNTGQQIGGAIGVASGDDHRHDVHRTLAGDHPPRTLCHRPR